MGTEQLGRKLAAILYADVAGYSRLTGKDEEGTHRALRTSLDFITACVSQHNGRVTHYAGDALLADFATVSDALSCAVDTQRELKGRNKDLSEDRKVQFRIGVNLGEVIVDREEIYGDGVNIAARLESLAAPGGICISGTVYDAIGTKLPLNYEFLGEQQVKNIDKPVRAYHVLLEPDAKVDRPRVPTKGKDVIVAVVAGVSALAVAGILTWLKPWQAREEPASVERMAFPLPDEPSVAVLPFSNLSGDPSQEYFSDGLTENIITTLSKVPNMFVIARNSTFTYKGRSVKVKRVAEELGIRYVLEGSFQRAGDKIRVHAQLIDALSGRHLWGERFDRTWTDIFVLQDDLTEKITSALSVRLTDEERARLARRYTNNVEAYDYFLRGQALYFRFTREDNARARELYQHAIDLDPAFARAYGALAVSHAYDSRLNWSSDPAVSLERAFELARKAAAIDDTLPQIQMMLGQIYLFKKRYEDALGAAQRAIALDSNYADAHALLAVTYTYTGRADMALQAMEKAMRRSPHPPALYHLILGRALYFIEQFEKALHALQRAVELNPGYLPSHVFLAATYGKLGNRGDAEWQKAQILGLDPDFSIQRWMARELVSESAYRDDLIDGLRKAGMPQGTAAVLAR